MAVLAIHPGEHLGEELKELGISASSLARQLHVPPNRITEILNGRRAISGDTALRLAHFFGTTPEFWLNLQSLYEIRLHSGNPANRFVGCRRWSNAPHRETLIQLWSHPSGAESPLQIRYGRRG
jgi:addiction module HigA family antidote